nr:reverse transcriptase domain-containing protein [Tanacetum cinerariifolium]
MIVKSLSPYNGIIGRPGLKAIQALPSTVHGMLKFLVEGGIVTICSTILIPTECASVITSSVVPSEERTRPANFKVALHPDFPDQEVAIGGTLSDKGRTELCSILKKNLDVFAWQPSDMTGVPRSIAEHRLNIREGYSPVLAEGVFLGKVSAAISDLKKCIKKSDFHWTVEAEQAFQQLKQHLSELPLLVAPKPQEELIIYLSATYEAISALAEADDEKTAFHTGHGVYCYTKMPFGLKNAGATYQRLIDKAFKGQIGQNIEKKVNSWDTSLMPRELGKIQEDSSGPRWCEVYCSPVPTVPLPQWNRPMQRIFKDYIGLEVKESLASDFYSLLKPT